MNNQPQVLLIIQAINLGKLDLECMTNQYVRTGQPCMGQRKFSNTASNNHKVTEPSSY